MREISRFYRLVRFLLALGGMVWAVGCASEHGFDGAEGDETTAAPKGAFDKPYDDEPTETVPSAREAGSVVTMPTIPTKDASPETQSDAGVPASADAGQSSMAPIDGASGQPQADAGAPVQPAPAKAWYEGRTLEAKIAATARKSVTSPIGLTTTCTNQYATNGRGVEQWTFSRAGDVVTLHRPGLPDEAAHQFSSGVHYFWDREPAVDGTLGRIGVALASEASFSVTYQVNAKADEYDAALGVTCGFTTFPVTAKWL